MKTHFEYEQIRIIVDLDINSNDLFTDIYDCLRKMEKKDLLTRKIFCNQQTKEIIVNCSKLHEWHIDTEGYCDTNQFMCARYVIYNSIKDMRIILLGYIDDLIPYHNI